MRLSWNEVRVRAADFAEDWKDAAYGKGETQSFCNAFFRVFGIQRRSVARYEQHVAKFDNTSGPWWPFTRTARVDHRPREGGDLYMSVPLEAANATSI